MTRNGERGRVLRKDPLLTGQIPFFTTTREFFSPALGTSHPSRERSVEDTTTLLERLAKLRDDEVINAAEFESLKGEVLSRA